jgi:hypothetical protein
MKLTNLSKPSKPSKPSKLSKLPKLPKAKFGNLTSPRGKTKSDKPATTGTFSPYELRRMNALPDANAEHFTHEDLANVLVNILTNPTEANRPQRILNILYCAVGGNNMLEDSNSFHEIRAYAKFLGKLEDPFKQMYVNTLFEALTPHLDDTLRNVLKNAYYEQKDNISALKQCLATHLGLEPSIELDEDLIKVPQQAIQLTMDNFGTVLNKAAHPARSAIYLILRAAGGTRQYEEAEMFPEIEAFGKSLAHLPDGHGQRLERVNELLEKAGDNIMNITRERIKFGIESALKNKGEIAAIEFLQRYCAAELN